MVYYVERVMSLEKHHLTVWINRENENYISSEMLYKTNSFLNKLSSFQIMVSLKSHVCWALLWFQGDILFLYT